MWRQATCPAGTESPDRPCRTRRFPRHAGPARAAGRLFVAAAQLKQHQHAGDNACQSVEVAALRHGVGMRANHDKGLGTAFFWQAQPQVAGSIPFMAQAQIFGPVLKYAQRSSLAFAIAFAGYAQAVTGGFANFRAGLAPVR